MPWWGAFKITGRLGAGGGLAVLLAVLAGGCGRSGPPDLAPVEAAFEIVTNTNRHLLDLALQQSRAGNYTGALASLDALERRFRLTPEQELAVQVLRRDLRRRLPAVATPPRGP